MLQPRPAWTLVPILLLALFFATGESEYLLKEESHGERIRRDNGGDVTVLSLEENGRFRDSPLGVLSSTARTFVQDGATTEYATQILGTTLGRTYARLLSTGTRVFYDNARPSKQDAYLVFPTIPGIVSPTWSSAQVEYQTAIPIPLVQLREEEKPRVEEKPVSFNEIPETPVENLQKHVSDASENVVSVHKEFSVKRNTELKPAKVRSDAGLPTFTVKNEFSPSGYATEESPKKEDPKKPRGGKGLFRGGVQIRNEFQKMDTVTYVGFADFTTTVGNTVIIFMPKTAASNTGAVTSISGEATLRPEDAAMPVVTTVKTFMSHSPGMATKTITGHNLNMQTSLPTIQADVRSSKAYNPVYTVETGTEAEEEVQPAQVQPSEASEPSIQPEELVHPTETLPTPTRFATTSTLVYNSADQPLGLVKSIGGTEAFNGTTTLFTSFLYGTVLNGAYTQLTQTASNIFVDPTPVLESTSATTEITTEHVETIQTTEKEVEEEKTTPKQEEESTEKDIFFRIQDSKEDEETMPSTSYTTQILPTTVYKTFTYLTTFFIPEEDGSTSTSVRSREVVSDEVQYVTSVLPADSGISKTDETIFPTAVTDSFETQTPSGPAEEITTERKYTEEEEVTQQFQDTTYETRPQVVDTTPQPAETTPHLVENKQETTMQEEETTPQQRETTPQQVDTTPRQKEMTIQTGDTTYDIGDTTQPLLDTTPELPQTTPKQMESTSQSRPQEPSTEGTTPGTTTEGEKEVELIFKTLYTTYTYLTTFFQETTTSVKSREVVVTNVLTSTLDSDFIIQASDPAVAGLFGRTDSIVSTEISPTATLSDARTTPLEENLFTSTLSSVDLENELVGKTTEEALYRTYTYYTTVFVDGETLVESRTEVLPIDATSTSPELRTALLDENNVVPISDQQVEAPTSGTKKKPVYGTIYRPKFTDKPNSELLTQPEFNSPIQSSIDDAYTYDTTMSRDHRTSATGFIDETTVPEANIRAREEELKKEAILAIGVTTVDEDEVFETMITDVTSSSSGGGVRIYEDLESDPNDQISSESNTEEIEPSFSPTLLLQTSYTTFTYFTTVYKGTSSDVISRLETVTNVVTETVRPTEIEAKLSPEEATLPITYFTTFTYWTTLYKGTKTMITSREETVSNIVTPVISPTLTTESIEMTQTAFPSSTLSSEIISPTEVSMEPTTFYTTYTYFTTSYIGNETVINSHLETETNIVTPTPTSMETQATSLPDVEMNETSLSGIETPALKPTGLISTIRTSEINDGTTTLLNTDIYGTYIDGLYAQVVESSTEVLQPSLSSSPPNDPTQPTGIVSLNEGKIVDADGISTIFYTTKAIGTYIDSLYAQIIESTSSIRVDEDKKTQLPAENPSTTVIGTKSYRTGLVRLIEGSIVKDRTTTFYESKVIGTLVDGRYAQIIESTSSFKVEMTSTPVTEISATSTSAANAEIIATVTTTSPSPDVIESSLSESQEQEDSKEEDSGGRTKSRLSFTSRKNTFTPSIRPFASRPRPSFLPKKKTGDPATTITRATFTPTVTATPASKSGFGSSRNRFAGNRKPSSSVAVAEVKPSSAGSRRFSRPRSSTGGFSSGYRGRTSAARIQPTATSSAGGSRRGGFNYRTSAPARFGSEARNPSSRFRIRPTATGGGRLFATATNAVDDVNSNDIGGTTVVTEDPELFTSEDEDQEVPTPAPTSTTESPRRNNNPLLRFRRPPILQRPSTTSTTPKPTPATTKRNLLLRRPDNRGPAPTPRSRTAPAAPSFNSRQRPRPGNNLFPPRGLFGRKPSPTEEEEEKEDIEKKEDDIEDGDEIEDNEYEGSETSETQSSTTTEAAKADRRGKAFNAVQIRPFLRRPRTKRQAEYGTRSYTSRYRRPSPRSQSPDYTDYNEKPSEPPRQTQGRFRSRSQQQAQKQAQKQPQKQTQQPQQQQQPRVRPSPVNNAPRAQFTLRERSQTNTNPRSNFRRPTSSPRRRVSSEPPSVVQRPKPPKLRTQTSQAEATTFTRNQQQRRFNTRRQSTRSRYRENTDTDTYTFSLSSFDGTITVTHKIPTEVTIPIVNGKNTEYKNVITAQPSLEVLGPNQYSTTTAKDGRPIIQLTSEITSTQSNGVVEITKFLVYETPTTSVTFTPTTLRGRKTSFSHVVPSTVYDVVPEVSTIQPKLGNAPLANLLLSQLLLGNLGLPNTLNPLAQAPASPTTEYKTKTTTYVTTVTDHTSTVIPITFRGKPIMTTIVDSSTKVITATEYITETVVVTPTQVPAINNQLNTLLLPALLQAQLLGQQQQSANPLFGTLQQLQNDQLLLQDKILEDEPEQRFLSRRKNNDEDEGNFKDIYDIEQPRTEHKARKKAKVKVKAQREQDLKHEETSLVTLYVSGKHPGEFSTVISTVTLGDESSIRKREVNYAAPDLDSYKVQISKTPELGSSFSEENYYDISSVLNDVEIESSEIETQSLESIVGDVSRYVTIEKSMNTDVLAKEYGHPSLTVSNEKSTGHFLLESPAESAPDQRIGYSRSEKNSRVKRQAEEQELPKRRRIRVKVPRRKEPVEHDDAFIASEAQREDEIAQQDFSGERESQDFGTRRIKIIRKKLPAPEPEKTKETPRKRIAVTRRRPLQHQTMSESYETQEETTKHEEMENTTHINGKRRRILVSKKRLIPTPEPSTHHKRRLIVTKRRPLQSYSTLPTEGFEDMSTVYNFQYAIPAKASGIGGDVTVSQMFMSDQLDIQQESEETEEDLDNVEVEKISEGEKTIFFDDYPTESEIVEPTETTEALESTSVQESSSTEIQEDEVSSTEESSQYDGPPRFVRPSRLSVTRKPSTSAATYIGFKRRRPVTANPVTESIIAPTKPPRFRPSSSSVVEEPVTPQQEEEVEEEPDIDVRILEHPNEPEDTEAETEPVQTSPEPVETDNTESPTPSPEVYVTKTLTTTRLRTFTYVVTRVSADEQVITSSTTVKPDVRTITVTELLPPSSHTAGEGRGYLATKVMSNGVEVIVAGDRSTVPGAPSLRILPSAPPNTPITLAPSTLTDHMMMLLPQESQKPHNEFVTKTYMTTYTYLTTFLQDGSTEVSSREKIVSNAVTEEIRPSRTKPVSHVTLTASPDLTTGVYHTTYTYLNTLVDGEVPLVVTSKKTVANTITEPSNAIQPSEVPVQDTNTYLSTVAYTKTLSDGDLMKVVSTEDVLTQVVITESDYLPSTVDIKPTAITKDVTKTYFVTYTYYSTLLDEKGNTVIKSDVATSSDVVTETFTIHPTRTQVQTSTDVSMNIPDANDPSGTFNLLATKTYLTTFTYFTTLLQDNKSPSIIVKSRTKVVQNIVTEKVDSSLLDSNYLSLLQTSVKNQGISPSSSQKLQITKTGTDLVRPTISPDIASSIEESSSSNVIKGSTIIFFDDEDPVDDFNLNSKTDDKLALKPTEALPLTSIKNTHSAANVSPIYKPQDIKISNDQDTKVPGISNNVPGVLEVANTENHLSNLFQIGALGVNGLSALGPVINAMAGLLGGDKKKNESITYVKPVRQPYPEISYAKEPLPPVPPTVRSPIYIPVGGLAAVDSEPSESQNIEGHNVYPDSNERNKPFGVVGLGHNIEAALLSGGIPISPGQVITTNSDVIIGKPAVHGPRPPIKSHTKDEVQGMKPPPLPLKSNWPVRDQSRYPSVLIPNRVPPSDEGLSYPPKRDHMPSQIRDHFKPNKEHEPPSHKHQINKNGNHHEFKIDHFGNDHKYAMDQINSYNPPNEYVDQQQGGGHQHHYVQMPDFMNKHKGNFGASKTPHHPIEIPIRSQVSPNRPENHILVGKPMKSDHDLPPNSYHVFPQQHPSRLHMDETSDLRPPAAPSPNEHFRPENNIIPTIPLKTIESSESHTHKPIGHNFYHVQTPLQKPEYNEPPVHPLLVNIQPSQVANVIIPHGSATAVIYKEEGDKHSQKGEIFNDPSPYPDAEVGMVGVAGLSTSGDGHHHAAHVPSNAVRMDVQVSPHVISIDTAQQKPNYDSIPSGFRRPVQGIALPEGFKHKQPLHQNIRLEYLNPPPPPSISSFVNHHLDHDSTEDGEDYSFSDGIESEVGDPVIQESKTRPLRPGQLPIELINRPSTSMPIDTPNERSTTPKPIVFAPTNFSANVGDIKYSVVNSKPVKLDPQNLNINQPPIINGKPVVSPFLDSSQATVSIGHKTHLKPSSTAQIPLEKPQYFPKPSKKGDTNSTLTKPFDNTVATMNMDERPPLPTFETPPQGVKYERPVLHDLQPEGNTPGPYGSVNFDRNSASHDDSVVGLSPPPPVTRLPLPEETTHVNIRRPIPIRKRPPPYKFEVPLPPTPESRPLKPTLYETERPPPPPIPTEVLSPPKPAGDYFKTSQDTKKQTTEQSSTTPDPEEINPILGGSLTVEELPPRTDVITAESNVVFSNVINGRPEVNNGKINPGIQTVLTGKPSVEPTPTVIHSNLPSNSWVNSVLVGSESSFGEVNTETLNRETPSKVLLATGATTIFGNLFTRPVVTSRLRPTTVTNSQKTFSIAIGPDLEKIKVSSIVDKMSTRRSSVNANYNKEVTPTKFVVTHTQTLTVTTTESMVIQKEGKKPTTHTLIVTKTMTSTVLDTVTEIHTLVKPTNILSTVTTTVSQTETTMIYPSKVPADKVYTTVTRVPQHEISEPEENESILVVMTDKNLGEKLPTNFPLDEITDIEGVDDESNEVSPNVLLGGILTHQPLETGCQPDCKATRNELCQKINNVMRCVCRPGFARMFPDRPCKPSYTYSLDLPLERYGREKIVYSSALQDANSGAYQSLSEKAKEGLDRMVMQSDLRDIYHGISVMEFNHGEKKDDTMVKFYIQLSENTDELRLQDVLKKYLRTNNFSIGGTEIYASKQKLQDLRAEDFDECNDRRFHDCSEHAQCFNLRGTYTCSCREGYTDLSHNTFYPGRICSAEVIGCERCNYHGTCYSRSDDEELCECFQWYAGQYCQINLKVLLLILLLVGACLVVLLIVCLFLSCMRRRPHVTSAPLRPPGFRPRPPQSDKRAMISLDTSSETSMENTPPPYIKQAVLNIQRPKPCRKQSKAPSPPLSLHGTMEQRDRSLTVMIPRAKYRPVPVQTGSNLLTMSTFGPEQKLLTYLTAEKPSSRANSRKPSNSTNHSHESVPKKCHSPPIRKPSTGALVSAGFEVSATVGRTKELDESFIAEPHTDLGQHAFSTIRTAESSIILDIPPPPTLEAELLDPTRVDLLTVSEARSYDETTIHPPTKSLRSHYDKHQCNDEGNTMVERDIGSTFVMPQSHLYKPDGCQGSDISNFDSL